MTPDECDDYLHSETWRDRMLAEYVTDIEKQARRQDWLMGGMFACALVALWAIAAVCQ